MFLVANTRDNPAKKTLISFCFYKPSQQTIQRNTRILQNQGYVSDNLALGCQHDCMDCGDSSKRFLFDYGRCNQCKHNCPVVKQGVTFRRCIILQYFFAIGSIRLCSNKSSQGITSSVHVRWSAGLAGLMLDVLLVTFFSLAEF